MRPVIRARKQMFGSILVQLDTTAFDVKSFYFVFYSVDFLCKNPVPFSTTSHNELFTQSREALLNLKGCIGERENYVS